MTPLTWIGEIRIGDVLQVAALLLSPIVAVRLQAASDRKREHRHLEAQREADRRHREDQLAAERRHADSENEKAIRERRERVFKDLMATRALPVSSARVNALNMIDLEFYGPGDAEKNVRQALESHMEALGMEMTPTNQELVISKHNETFSRVLYLMARCLGYDFTETHLRKSVYYPKGHATFSERLERSQAAALQILEGERILTVKVQPAEAPEAPGRNVLRTADGSREFK